MKKSIYIYLGLLFVSFVMNAQQPIQQPEIKVLSRAQQTKILLRWSADTPAAWKLLTTQGVTLERLTVTRDRKTLTMPERKLIGTIVPDPLESWDSLIDTNDNAAIMAQAIYGESFEVSGGSKIETLISMSEELQQRFTFALFAAEQDFAVATKAGLGYVDTDVKPNEKYLYKITSNVPEATLKIAPGGVFVGLSDYEELPEPLDLAGVFNDSSVMLSWNFKILNTTYNSYNIERSQDGVSFKRINKTPYTVMNQNVLDQKNGRIFYVDSVANNIKYSYRVKGITSFGEEGPASEVISGEGKVVLKHVPHLRKKEIQNSSTVKLSWEFPEEGNDQILRFELNRAEKESGPYKIVVPDIAPQERSIVYNDLLPTNYFTLTAVGKQNNKRTSFAMLVQPVDSIPPSRPVGLTGTIDTLGVVKLKWNDNAETDMLGYRVYIANDKTHEFSQLTVNPIKRNNYVDTVNVKNLNNKIYYKVTALDKRYNMSKFSEVLELKKPDIIPPTAPVFKSYKLSDEGTINLVWAQSSSPDVDRYILYRKQNNNKEWVLIFEGNKEEKSFVDKKIEEGNLYSYTILAVDESGLESSPSPSVSVGVKRLGLKPKVRGFYGTLDKEKKTITLSWNYKELNVAEFEIYRAENDQKTRLFRIVPAGTKVVKDNDLSINTTYTYMIRAVFKDGNVSKTNDFKVKY